MMVYELVAEAYSEPDHYSVAFYTTRRSANKHKKLAEDWNKIFKDFDIYYKIQANMINPYDENSYGDTKYAVVEHEIVTNAPTKKKTEYFDPRISLTKEEQNILKRLKVLGVAEGINIDVDGKLPIRIDELILLKLVEKGLAEYEDDCAQLTPNGVLVYHWYRSQGKFNTW